MTGEYTQAQWLHEQTEISIEQLAELSGASHEMLRELVDFGALIPTNVQSEHWTFTPDCIVSVRAAARLQTDFDLDVNSLSVALGLMERIRTLEAQLRELQSQLPRLRRIG
ncbi:MAG: chaperone modulator CbpM [Burkholderiales bacterium]|jgi:chaperone modulatory protein CbpM